MQKQLTKLQMSEIAINFLLERLDIAVENKDQEKVMEISKSIEKILSDMEQNTIHVKTIH